MNERAQRNREKRTREDGTEIDPVKDLAEYVQTFPMSAEPEPRPKVEAKPKEAGAAPTPEPVQPKPVQETGRSESESGVSAGSGVPPPPVPVQIPPIQVDRAVQLERELAQIKSERDRLQQQRDIDTAAQRAVQTHLAPKEAPPAPEAEDARWERVDELWFTDQKAARKLMAEINRDQFKTWQQEERKAVKQEVFAEMTEAQRKEQGSLAFFGSMQKIQKAGIPEAHITADRVNALYATITRPPTANTPNPYFEAGGPLNEEVIVKAWGDLYGFPQAAPVAPAAPVVVAPLAPPPGSGRPAPAAAAPASRDTTQVHLSAQEKKEIEHMANAYNMDPKKLEERRRARKAAGR